MLDEWQQERKEYPGWLALPRRNQKLLRQRTKELRAPLVEWVTTLPPAQRLRPMTELLWRLHKSVQLLFVREVQLGQDALAAVPLPADPEQQEQWAQLAFLLLQDLRRSYNHSEFETLLTQLESLSQRRPHYAAWRCWQAALERLEHLDQAGARHWLRQWPDIPTDPAWDLRRAGLWAELDELDSAERYAQAALQVALQLQPRLTIRIDMLDVEAAARVLLRQIQGAQCIRTEWPRPAGRCNAPLRPGPGWGELARQKLYTEYRCDAAADTEHATVELSRDEPTMQQARYERVDPYSSVRSRFRTGRGGLDIAAYQPAFEVLDAQEQRGLPFWFAHGQYERLELAGQWLLTIALPRALGLLVRSGNEALLERIDKAAWAGLEDDRLLPLLQQNISLIEEVFPSVAPRPLPAVSPSHYVIRYVGLALRLLGRAAFRLDPPRAQKSLTELRDQAVQVVWRVWAHWFNGAFMKLAAFTDFTEGLAAVLRPEEVQAQMPLLIAAAPEPEYTVSALASLPPELLAAERPSTEAIARAIATCLGWLTQPLGSDQQRAGLRRLLYLHQIGWLTATEQITLGTHLWASASSPDTLPMLGNDLLAGVVLLLPIPAGTDAAALLKAHLLAELQALFGTQLENTAGPGVNLENTLSDILHATHPAPDRLVLPEPTSRQWLTWTAAEAQQLLDWTEQLLKRLAEEANSSRSPELLDWTSVEKECRHLGSLLADVILPALPLDDKATADRVYACATQLLAAKLPARTVLPLLLPRQVGSAGSAATSIHLALLHPTEAAIAQDGAEALCRWAYAAHQGYLPSLPDGLFSEFVLRTGMVDLPDLPTVLVLATTLLTLAPQFFWPAYAPVLGDTLSTLLAATSLPAMRERNLARNPGEQARLFQRPRLRELAAQLAGQFTWLQVQLPVEAPTLLTTLTEWQEDVDQDEFPAVRRAWQAGYTDLTLHRNWASSTSAEM